MFYHVLVETKNKDNNGKFISVYEADHQDMDSLQEEVLLPYLKKEEVWIDGRMIAFDEINQLKVFTSKFEIDMIWNGVTMQGGFSSLVHRKSMLHERYMTDVTKDILRPLKQNVSKNIDSNHVDANFLISNQKIFLVHGRDGEAKSEVARFIQMIGLEPIILHEQANNGNTLIEKIEEHTDVGFGIILYTPCDIGGLSKDELKPRARQNVIFEHGYLLAKLGRKRVAALVKANVESPSDISGMVYIKHDDNNGWKFDLIKELIALGYNIDTQVLFKK